MGLKNKQYWEWINQHSLFIGIVALVLIKNWLLEAQPIIATLGWPHDNTHFINQATDILNGYWLGSFGENTLIKGPIYPLWISLNHIVGLDILHSQDLLYMFACLIVMLAVKVKVENRLFLFFVFAFLYLNPPSYNYLSIAHTMRLAIYPSLTLLTFGALLGLVLRLEDNNTGQWRWALLFGVAFSLFWYTREEGLFLVPSLVLIMGSSLIYVILPGFKGSRLKAVTNLLLVPILALSSVTGLLVYQNWKNYGITYVIETKTENHMRAQNAFLRVKPDEWRRYHELEPGQRAKIFSVSSKAKELEPSFEGHGYFGAGLSSWAVRQAVANAGYYDRGAKAVDEFYDAMATEIEQACDSGKLECADLLFPGIPVWRPVFTADFPGAFVKELKQLIRFKSFSTRTDNEYSFGDASYFYFHEILTHSRARPGKGAIKDENNFHTWLKDFKLDVLESAGYVHQKLRPSLFYLSLLLLFWLSFKAIKNKDFDQAIIFSYAVLGAIFSLATILTIITVAVYEDSFRASHGALPLPALFTIIVMVGYINYIKKNKTDKALADE